MRNVQLTCVFGTCFIVRRLTWSRRRTTGCCQVGLCNCLVDRHRLNQLRRQPVTNCATSYKYYIIIAVPVLEFMHISCSSDELDRMAYDWKIAICCEQAAARASWGTAHREF